MVCLLTPLAVHNSNMPVLLKCTLLDPCPADQRSVLLLVEQKSSQAGLNMIFNLIAATVQEGSISTYTNVLSACDSYSFPPTSSTHTPSSVTRSY